MTELFVAAEQTASCLPYNHNHNRLFKIEMKDYSIHQKRIHHVHKNSSLTQIHSGLQMQKGWTTPVE